MLKDWCPGKSSGSRRFCKSTILVVQRRISIANNLANYYNNYTCMYHSRPELANYNNSTSMCHSRPTTLGRACFRVIQCDSSFHRASLELDEALILKWEECVEARDDGGKAVEAADGGCALGRAAAGAGAGRRALGRRRAPGSWPGSQEGCAGIEIPNLTYCKDMVASCKTRLRYS